jgi:tripartite-type tricarboxylate transporter receptor subunit TctC
VHPHTRTPIRTIVGVLLAVAAGTALAQAYPAKPVRFLTASTGSPQDVIGRLYGQRLSETWGQQVVVENRAGGGALLSMQAAAKAPADGYSVLVASSAFAVTPSLFPNAGFDAEKDLVPVTLLATSPNVFVTAPSTGIKSLKDAVERARTAKLTYGSPGFSTTPQLSAEYLFKSLARVPSTHVPYKGIPPLVGGALAGEVDVAALSLPPAVPQIRAGKLVGLAVTSAKRSPALPDVPTIAEAGFTGFEDETWVGVWVPAGTPRAVIDRLDEELQKASASPELRERLAAIGFAPSPVRGDAFTAYVKREIDKWTKVVRETGAKAE